MELSYKQRLFAYFSLLSTVVVLAGCEAAEVSIAKKNLDVQTKMSETVFLDPVSPDKQVVYIRIRNTSDKPDFDIESPIRAAIAARGYRITENPDQAHYQLQANVLSVSKASPTAAQAALHNGYGGEAVLGALAGGAIHEDNRLAGAAVGGLLLGGASMIANNMVKDVTFVAITDIQISERAKEGVVVRSDSKQDLKQGIGGAQTQTSSEVGDMKKYRTRIVSTANKVNLEYAEASKPLNDGLVRSITGLF